MSCDIPCAAEGLISYRSKSPFGWVMIGALNVEDAIKQAKRSTSFTSIDTLERWNGAHYVKVTQ